MKNAISNKTIIIALLVVLLVALFPSPAVAADSDLVRFSLENRDSSAITIRLYSQDVSGLAYYMTVAAGTSKFLTLQAGVYDYRLSACGVVVRGELDLSRHHAWVFPPCGSKGGEGTKAPNTTDASEIVRLVRVDLVNESSTRMLLLLEGPYDYVFVIEGKGTKVVTILKGTYDYTLFACFTGHFHGSFLARANKVQEFDCS